MSTQADLNVGKSALSVCRAEDARTCQSVQAEFAMVGNEKLVRRSFLESLGTVPGHVLDH